MSSNIIVKILLFFLVLLPLTVRSDNANLEVPQDGSKLESWFTSTFGAPTSVATSGLKRGGMNGGGPLKVITVRKDGSGNFETVSDAVQSVPEGNKQRVIVWIGPGNYTEKISINATKPFVTFYGDPTDMPVLVFNETAAKHGTVWSATLTVESDHFVGINLKVVNSAPRPDGKRAGAQAVALRIGGDASVFYNCKFYGFQDTVFDYKGRHLFKDCYIEGTVDFIFGSGKSIYLNTEIHVIPGDHMAIITAHARSDNEETTAFIFLHCSVTGTGEIAFLGRSWFPYPRVVFAYSYLSDAVNPQGWFNNLHPETNRTVYFGEYKNDGPGSDLSKRVTFSKKLNQQDAKPFISLAYVDADQWLLPPVIMDLPSSPEPSNPSLPSSPEPSSPEPPEPSSSAPVPSSPEPSSSSPVPSSPEPEPSSPVPSSPAAGIKKHRLCFHLRRKWVICI